MGKYPGGYTRSDQSPIKGERWRPIDDFEDYYLISDYGRVKRIKKTQTSRVGWILKSSRKNFYSVAILIRNNQRVMKLVHRLVGFAFIPNPENKPLINHKDGDKSNNHFTNLEWVTHSENHAHAYATGLRKVNPEHVHQSKLNWKQVRNLRKLSKNGHVDGSLSIKFKVCIQQVRNIIRNKVWIE